MYSFFTGNDLTALFKLAVAYVCLLWSFEVAEYLFQALFNFDRAFGLLKLGDDSRLLLNNF